MTAQTEAIDRLKARIAHLEARVKAADELAEALHRIDPWDEIEARIAAYRATMETET